MFDLKPCPFCGGEAVLYVDNGVRVYCRRCGAQSKTRCDNMSYSKPTNATAAVIEAWNRRDGNETD